MWKTDNNVVYYVDNLFTILLLLLLFFFFFLRIYLWRPENRGRIQQTVIIIIKHFKPEEGTRQGIEGEGTKYFLEG